MGLDKLFRYKAKVEIGDEIKLWMRALSDVDIHSLDEHALLAMMRRRKELNDPTSKAHELYIAGLKTADIEDLRQTILTAVRSDAQRQATSQFPDRAIPMPDDADDEEKASVLERRQSSETEIAQKRAELIDQQVKAFADSIKDHSREQLSNMAIGYQIQELSRIAMLRASQEYTVFASCYEDEACEIPMFASPEEVSQLNPQVLTALINTYYKRIDTVKVVDLQHFFSTEGSRDSSILGKPSDATQKPSAVKAPKKSRGGGR